jgi:hypothetical protein
VTEYEYDRWYGDSEMEVFEEIFKTFDIPTAKAVDFVRHLFKYPMLALQHEVAETIYNKLFKR